MFLAYSNRLRFLLFVNLQINLCYLCQTCTYLLHSRNMLHHYLQVRQTLPWCYWD